MKKVYFIVVLLLPIMVFAHPGRLDSSGCHYCRTNCANWGLDTNEYHCHTGNTYSNSKGEVYSKDGIKVSSSSSSNNDSADRDEVVNNNDSSTSNENVNSEKNETVENNSSSTNSTSKDTESTNSNSSSSSKVDASNKENATSKPASKSKDFSLKSVKVDGDELVILDEMEYETNNKNVVLEVKANDKKANVEYDCSDLSLGDNEIIITVTAEAGNVKKYKLVITRKEVISDVEINKFVFNKTNVTFENNEGVIKLLSDVNSFDYSYELSDESASLLIFLNDKEVKEINKLNNEDVITLVIVDKNDNKNTYKIDVVVEEKKEDKQKNEETESSIIIDIIAYIIVFGILLLPVVIICLVVYFIISKYRKNKMKI